MCKYQKGQAPLNDEESSSDRPLVSIIMSVYNCESTVNDAILSIFDQTYTNWELIVCDDASTDKTLENLRETLKNLAPEKYTLLINDTNRRLAFSLNRCLKAASGEFIARMDGDDVSLPERLEKQVSFLIENPAVDLVGTAMRRFNSEGPGEVLQPANLQPDIKSLGRSSRTPFAHATILARRNVFDKVGNYTVSRRTARAEDLDLWYKFFAAGLHGRNLPIPLYCVREDGAAIRRRTPQSRLDAVIIRFQGNRKLRYPLRGYIPAIIEFVKVFIPYSVFDWHREWSRRRALTDAES